MQFTHGCANTLFESSASEVMRSLRPTNANVVMFFDILKEWRVSQILAIMCMKREHCKIF